MASDGASNSVTALRHVQLDTQAPVLTVNAPQDGALASNGSVAVDGSVHDATATTVMANRSAPTVSPPTLDGGPRADLGMQPGSTT